MAFSGCHVLAFSSSLVSSSIDFSKPISSALQSHSTRFVAKSGGKAQVILSWWDLEMDSSGNIVCTMAPSWTYKEPKMAPVSGGQSVTVLSGSHEPLLITVLCFSGGTTGCRACTFCQRSAAWHRERCSVSPSAMTTTACGTVCSLPGNCSEMTYCIK